MMNCPCCEDGGDFEMEEETEDGAAVQWQRCTKNPGHKKFIPYTEFTKNHLPECFRTDECLNKIHLIAELTCKLTIGYTSANRPDNDPNKKLRGKRINRTGTGYVEKNTKSIFMKENYSYFFRHTKFEDKGAVENDKQRKEQVEYAVDMTDGRKEMKRRLAAAGYDPSFIDTMSDLQVFQFFRAQETYIERFLRHDAIFLDADERRSFLAKAEGPLLNDEEVEKLYDEFCEFSRREYDLGDVFIDKELFKNRYHYYHSLIQKAEVERTELANFIMNRSSLNLKPLDAILSSLNDEKQSSSDELPKIDETTKTDETPNVDELQKGNEPPKVDVGTKVHTSSKINETPKINELKMRSDLPNVDETPQADTTPKIDEISKVDELPKINELPKVDETRKIDKKPMVNEIASTSDKKKHMFLSFPTYWQEVQPCPCPECDRASTRADTGYLVNIRTANHVIFDDDEAKSIKVEFFYDTEDKAGVKVMYGTKLCLKYTTEDNCNLICVTHDLDLVNRLYYMYLTHMDTYPQPKESDPPYAVVCSHPHGYIKHITCGDWTRRWIHTFRTDEYCAFTNYEYSTPTCPGSSGAPVLILGRKKNTQPMTRNVHPHQGTTRNKLINKSGVHLDYFERDDRLYKLAYYVADPRKP